MQDPLLNVSVKSKIDATIKAYMAFTKKTMFEALRFMAKRYCISMKTQSSPSVLKSASKREIIINPNLNPQDQRLVQNKSKYLDILKYKVDRNLLSHEEKQDLDRIKKNKILLTDPKMKMYGIKVLKQNKPTQIVLTDKPKKEAVYKIRSRGLFNKVASVMEAQTATLQENEIKRDMDSTVMSKSGDSKFMIFLKNRLGYILKKSPSIHKNAVTSAVNQVNGMLIRKISEFEQTQNLKSNEPQ